MVLLFHPYGIAIPSIWFNHSILMALQFHHYGLTSAAAKVNRRKAEVQFPCRRGNHRLSPTKSEHITRSVFGCVFGRLMPRFSFPVNLLPQQNNFSCRSKSPSTAATKGDALRTPHVCASLDPWHALPPTKPLYTKPLCIFS